MPPRISIFRRLSMVRFSVVLLLTPLAALVPLVLQRRFIEKAHCCNLS